MIQQIQDVMTEDTKRRLKALKPGETRRELLWKECVANAKILQRHRDDIRFQIVELANKCCVIHHGGSCRKERYTVTNFAKEIDLNPKTLIEWMRVKKHVYDNLSEDQRKQFTLTDLRYIDKMLVGQEKSKDYPAKVQKAFRTMQKQHPVTRKMTKYLKSIKSIHFNTQHKMMIKDCDKEVLAEMLHVARAIAKNLAWIDTETKATK